RLSIKSSREFFRKGREIMSFASPPRHEPKFPAPGFQAQPWERGIGPRGVWRHWQIVRKYWNICRVSLIERLTYRADFFLATILRFLPMLTTILLWQAVYAGANATSGQRKLSGFTFDEMVAYLLLVHISRMFSSMPGLAAGIARDVREGTLKKYLIQPIDMIGYLVSYRAAHKMAYIATTVLPYGFLFFLCRSYFVGISVTDRKSVV